MTVVEVEDRVSVMLSVDDRRRLVFLEPDEARDLGWAIVEAAGVAEHIAEEGS